VRVVLASQAQRDLKQIGDYIAHDSPGRARGFVNELVAKAIELGDFPARFPLLPRYETGGVRHRTHRGYLILYRVELDRILVMRFIHGARDYPSLLGPDA
jgi:toxin ParE1/3/4